MKISSLRFATAVALVLALAAAAGAQGTTVLTVGATPVPHAEILEFIKPALQAEGIELRIVEFTDYVLPNLALAEGELDANYFQHIPYLETFAADHRLNLTVLVGVHIEPMGLYSRKYTSLDQLPRGATIAIPNDATNGGRALLLLQQAGLIRLSDDVGITGTVFDIVDNPRNLRFRELEAPLLPRALEDVDAAVINTNYALEAGLVPLRDALVIEGAESPYVNVVAVRAGDENNPALLKLAEALLKPEVRQFILDRYAGAVVPVF
ncbi:MAG: MetQ/NlpA family ABC transporter substrate-binding protein [Bacillota bacterium]|nr:methionine ABC transporter substrate-binding protein [Bacillota bacterium]REJ36720.1 MAG: methionine ABC transporter substrate-binding protein [Bacillota bacterium]